MQGKEWKNMHSQYRVEKNVNLHIFEKLFNIIKTIEKYTLWLSNSISRTISNRNSHQSRQTYVEKPHMPINRTLVK